MKFKLQCMLFMTLFLLAAAAPVNAQTHVFARGADGTLMHFDGAQWRSLGGGAVGAPDACSWGPDRVDVFVRGEDNKLWQKARIDGQWAPWHNHGGSLTSAPTCVSSAPNRIDVFARGAGGTVIHRSWTGSQWTEWQSLGGELPEGSAPDAASWGANRIDVFIRGTDGALWQKASTGTGSTLWHKLGGTLTSDPGAVSWGPNRIDVFARGTDGQMMQIAWNGTRWTDWFPQGGRFNAGSSPDAASVATNRLAMFARGEDGALWRKQWDGSRWGEWLRIGGAITSDPGAVALRRGAVVSPYPDVPTPRPNPAPTSTRGRFRVTLNGFTVNRETWDDALERDGKRDEVFFVYAARVFNAAKEQLSDSGVLQSRVMGDINRDDWRTTRVQAGSASDLGGLLTGDNFPGDAPWVRNAEPEGDRLPLLLWEGELAAGGNTVVVVPTLWEWDGEPDFLSKVHNLFGAPVNFLASALGDAITPVSGEDYTNGGSTVFRQAIVRVNAEGELGSNVSLSRNVLGDPKDRPIGMLDAGSDGFRFAPLALRLGYEGASEIARTNFGRGNGVVLLRYRDPDFLKGDYTLYVQVERLP